MDLWVVCASNTPAPDPLFNGACLSNVLGLPQQTFKDFTACNYDNGYFVPRALLEELNGDGAQHVFTDATVTQSWTLGSLQALAARCDAIEARLTAIGA